MNILDAKAKEAYSKAVANEATDLEWVILFLDRQCRKLDAIHDDVKDVRAKVDTFDRIRTNAKRLAVILFGGVSITSIAVAVAIRVLTT